MKKTVLNEQNNIAERRLNEALAALPMSHGCRLWNGAEGKPNRSPPSDGHQDREPGDGGLSDEHGRADENAVDDDPGGRMRLIGAAEEHRGWNGHTDNP